jgi:uncharacterized protein (TIGR00255 family)
MTGFGRGEAWAGNYKITVEIRSINNRYLEVVSRMPRNISSLEDKVKHLVNDNISRGRADVFISLEDGDERVKTLKVDKDLALAYHNSLLEIAELCGLPKKLDIATIAALPGLFAMEKPEDDLEEIWPLLAKALAEALEQLISMRSIEGAKLADDLLVRKEAILAWVADIEKRAPFVVLEWQARLEERIKELLGEAYHLDENRMANEVAVFADRASIAEEIIRLQSHLEQLEQVLKSNEVAGRKLDFLVQEMNREINTIGSKANDLEISRLVIQIKGELEKIREQVQNIE